MRAMGRAYVAIACVVAGVAWLAGPGWALLTAGALIFATPTPTRARAAATAAGAWGSARVRAGWRWLTSSRRSTAIASMPSAMVLIPAGMWVVAGVGWALLALGTLAGGLSLLAGWNT